MAPRVFQHSAPVSSSHEHPCTNRTTAHTANLLSSPASMSAQRHLQPISFHLQQPMSATAHSANQLSSPAANERTCINHIKRINRTTVHTANLLSSRTLAQNSQSAVSSSQHVNYRFFFCFRFSHLCMAPRVFRATLSSRFQ